MATAYIIHNASNQEKEQMAGLVAQMNDESWARCCSDETSVFTLNGIEAIEVLSKDSGDVSTFEWHFVKCSCGQIDIRHGEEEEEACYCWNCKEFQGLPLCRRVNRLKKELKKRKVLCAG